MNAEKIFTYLGEIDDYIIEESTMARIRPRVYEKKREIDYLTVAKGVTGVVAALYLLKRVRNNKRDKVS